MILKNTLGLFIASIILGGCYTTPQQIDSYPVHASFAVSESLDSLYYRLTTATIKDGACSQIFNAFMYQDRGEFRIYYGANVGSATGGGIFLNNAVYAKKQGASTNVDIKKTSSAVGHERNTAKLVNFIKTGRCE